MRPFGIYIIGLVALAGTLKAGNLPEGDQYAATLTKSLDEVVSASALLDQGIKESRSTEQVLHTLSVFADVWDTLCAHFTQCIVWVDFCNRDEPGSASAQFSEPGRAQMRKFLERYRNFTKTFRLFNPQNDAAILQYERDDPRIKQEEDKVRSSVDTMKAVLSRAGVQW
jgi:hypothetical protein